MFYIIKQRYYVDEVEVLGAYANLKEAKRWLPKVGNKAAGMESLIQHNSWTRFYETCSVGITTEL